MTACPYLAPRDNFIPLSSLIPPQALQPSQFLENPHLRRFCVDTGSMAATKVSLASQTDLKNASDDAIANYLNSLSFTQTHTLGDVRLALGYGSFFVSAACFAWDYKFGFESTKYYSAAAVAVYVVLQGVLWWWTKWVEEGCVYQGVAPSGEQVSCSAQNP